MKLLNLVPILFEDDTEDNPFAEPKRPVSPQLLQELGQRIRAIGRQISLNKRILLDMAEIPGCYTYYTYPGGWQQAATDTVEKKVLLTKVDFMWGRGNKSRKTGRRVTSMNHFIFANTPEGHEFMHRLNARVHRIYHLMSIEERLRVKLDRDDRIIAARIGRKV